MGWVRISDDFYDHEKFYGVTALGIATWVAGLAHANRNLTDGFVSKRAARGLVGLDRLAINESEFTGRDVEPDDGIDELLAAGIWHAQGHACPTCPDVSRLEYYIHNYLEFQPSKAEVEEKARERSEAGKRGADKRWNRGSKGKPMADPMATAIATPMADPIANAWQNDAPNPNPNPLYGDEISISPVLNREAENLTDGEQSAEEVSARLAEQLYGVEWLKIRNKVGTLIGGFPNPSFVMALIAEVHDRAKKPIKSPTGVVLSSLENDWADWQKRYFEQEGAA